MATIKDWFQTKNYDAGLIILSRHTKNRALILSLGRKRNPAKLEYELKKLMVAKGGKLVVFPHVIKREEPKKEKVIIPLPNPSMLKIVHNKKQVAIDDLPKDLQDKWAVNRDAYKEIRSLHEKLKLMAKASDSDRQPLVSRIIELDALIRENWKSIDSWKPGTPVVAPIEEAPVIQPDYRRVNANRKYISTGIKKIVEGRVKGDKLITLKQSILARFIELKNVGIEMTQDTVDELIKVGIDI